MEKNTKLLIIWLVTIGIAALIVTIAVVYKNYERFQRKEAQQADFESENQTEGAPDILSLFSNDPLYRTDGSLVVDAIKQGQAYSSQELVKLFKELLSSKSFLTMISEDMDGRYSPNELKGMISCSSRNETQVLEVVVIGKVPQDVYDICHSVLIHATDTLPDYTGGKVRLLDDAYVPKKYISDK